ncbi:MAG: hypothetical protein IT303_17490 [Dehalococcoidia bacterium]|nr:hypothetical protein [Dehalococcoidia bacterium]
MGKGSAEIQRDIEHRRRALSDRINRLDARVRDDVEEVKGEVEARQHQLVDRAKDTASTAKEKVAGLNDRLPGSDSKLATHPNLLLLGSFAAGVVAGVATGGDDGGGGRSRRRDDRSRRDHEDEGSGFLGKGVDSAKAYLGTELATALKELADQAFGRGDGKAMEHGMPGMLKSAWENMSGAISRDGKDDGHSNGHGLPRDDTHMSTHEAEFPDDRPLSDLEQRARAELRN